MYQKLRKLPQLRSIMHIATYFSGHLIKATLPFIILPFLTMYLSPSEYGVWNVYLAILSLIVPVTACGLPMTLGRNYHINSRDEHRAMVGTSALAIFILCAALLIFIGCYDLAYDQFMGIPMVWFYALPFLCFVQNLQSLNKVIIRQEHRATLFTILDTINAAMVRFSGLAFVIFISATWVSMFTAHVIVQIIFAAITIMLFIRYRQISLNTDRKRLKHMMNMGWPLIFHAIGGIIMNMSDRLILQDMMGAEEVGIYSLGANLGVAILMFCHAFNYKWSPWIYTKLKNPDNATKQKIVRYTYYYFAITICLGLCVAAFGIGYIYFLIDPAYYEAIEIVGWVTAGATFYGLSFPITHYIIFLGDMKLLPTVTGAAALLNIILTIYMVGEFGITGAAQATLFTYILFFTTMWAVNAKRYPMPWFLNNSRERAE